MALYAGLYLGLGFVDEVFGLHGPLHRQGVAGETVAGFVPELAVLFFVTAAAHLRGGQAQLLMIVSVAGVTGYGRLGPAVAAGAPVVDDARGDALVAADAQLAFEAALY